MRNAHRCCFGHLGMGDHGAFYLRGAHAVPRHVEHVIDSSGDPVIAILVATRAIAGKVHAAEGLEVGVDEAVVVLVDGAHLPRPGVEDHQIRSEEHTSELQSLMRTSYAVFCLKYKNNTRRSGTH